MNNPLPRLGVLFSGGGRTVENIARNILEGSLEAEIAIAISSHEEAGGIERARGFGKLSSCPLAFDGAAGILRQP